MKYIFCLLSLTSLILQAQLPAVPAATTRPPLVYVIPSLAALSNRPPVHTSKPNIAIDAKEKKEGKTRPPERETRNPFQENAMPIYIMSLEELNSKLSPAGAEVAPKPAPCCTIL